MTDDDDRLLSPEQLARYEVPGAPDGFATRMMNAIAREEQTLIVPIWRSRRWLALAAAAAAVVAVVIAGVLVFAAGGSRSASGARVATTRATIAIGDRGLAVAEAGTELRWRVQADGDAVVEQWSGSVFYRVEHGGDFVVRTPLGDVKVTGTCFSVEVMAMQNPIKKDIVKGAVVGAVLTAAVFVTVYEGGVSLASSRGTVQMAAGESASVRPGEPPITSVVARAGLDPQARALADAQARIAKLEGELSAARGGDAAASSSETKQDPARYYDPSAETLRKMADTCWIAYDQPPFSDDRPDLVDDELAGEAQLTDAERNAINQAYRKVEDRAIAAERKLYMELTGLDADAAAALSSDAIYAEIRSKSPAEDEINARRRIARERAGLEPAPSPAELARRPVVERHMRLMANLGHEAEAAAASVIGARRARQLRTHGGIGWYNTVTDYGGCDFKL